MIKRYRVWRVLMDERSYEELTAETPKQAVGRMNDMDARNGVKPFFYQVQRFNNNGTLIRVGNYSTQGRKLQ